MEADPVEAVTLGGPDGISIPLVGDCVVAGIASPEHVARIAEKPAEPYTREEIERACLRLMEQKDTYRGTGIPGVLWNVGFRLVYQKREGTEKQIECIRVLMMKAPDKYAQLLA